MGNLPVWVWTTIALSITATWVLLNVIDALSIDYAVDPMIHAVMGGVVGATGAGGIIAKRQEEEKK